MNNYFYIPPPIFDDMHGFNINDQLIIVENIQNLEDYGKNKFIQIAENVQEERLNICKGCEFYKNESNEPICTQCNCLLKKKVSLVEESCPLKKWLAIKTQSSGGCGCNKK